MKKIAPILAIAFVVAMVSCKKDYNCKCTTTISGVTADTLISLGKVKKKDAKTSCDAWQTTYTPLVNAFGGTLACDIEKK